MAALDALLRQRVFVEPSEFAVNDILSAARAITREKPTRPLYSPAFSIRDVLARYIEPAPAFAFVSLLMLGLWMGQQHAETITQPDTLTTESIAAAESLSMADEEGVL